MKRTVGRLLRRYGYRLERIQNDPYVERLTSDAVALPPGAETELRSDNPKLVALRDAYDALGWPVCIHSRWRRGGADAWLDLKHFRGDNAYLWHYRESERVSQLKYFVYLRYVLERDPGGLLGTLGEDGAFGCWTYRYPSYPTVSRDLLDSVNELLFVDAHTGLLASPSRVLDIGAGYGRLAHRMSGAASSLTDYCCVDAVPESTFLCEYYARFRAVTPPVRVVPLYDVPSLQPGSFDIAFNVHSFSECSHGAVQWWLEQLQRLQVPRLFLVPNEPEGFLTTEPDGKRLDYGSLIADAGYRLVAEQRVYADDAVRELMGIDDRYCLFERS